MSLEKSLGTTQGHEFKSKPADRRSTSRLGVCNNWTSKKNWDQDLQSVQSQLACTFKENRDESQETFRSWQTEPEERRIWSFSSYNSSTHLSLLFRTEWFWNSVAEIRGSRGAGTWGHHQFCAREVNVFFWHRVKERQCFEVAQVFYGEHSRRAQSDVTELWLADDLDSLVC